MALSTPERRGARWRVPDNNWTSSATGCWRIGGAVGVKQNDLARHLGVRRSQASYGERRGCRDVTMERAVRVIVALDVWAQECRP
jgi:hypothetical protein